ncbi:YbdD/YjiX family protein [Kineococcus glutinatus]|uniref:YbdD/YjiX family protein n=1 Tax=Kineococcus glutinatus TaxID=1070872 RepID=A0ABP9HXU8_9ACTN
MSGVLTRVRRAARGVRWYARALAGETAWDDYLARCAAHGHDPVPRREFERARTDALAGAVRSRCC